MDKYLRNFIIGKKKVKVNSKYIQIDQKMYMFTVDKCIYL